MDPMGIFVRVAAVLVGLTNLAALAGLNSVGEAIRRGDVTWEYDALPVVLAVAVAGLATSEIVLRWLGASITARGFAPRYRASVFAVGLGGALMGFLLAYVLTVERVLGPGPPSIPGLVLVALGPGLVGLAFGLVLGLAEGFILALPLAAVLGTFRRSRYGGHGSSFFGLVLLCLLVVAMLGSLYSVVPATPPETEMAGLRDEPSLSCPEYLGNEIGTFYGPGDQTTPAFETTGDGWGYEFASSGPGSLTVTVLDGDGNTVGDSDEFPSGGEATLGEGVGGTEFAFSGTFSLEIDAEDDVDYRILVCDGTDQSGRNKADLSP